MTTKSLKGLLSKLLTLYLDTLGADGQNISCKTMPLGICDRQSPSHRRECLLNGTKGGEPPVTHAMYVLSIVPQMDWDYESTDGSILYYTVGHQGIYITHNINQMTFCKVHLFKT